MSVVNACNMVLVRLFRESMSASLFASLFARVAVAAMASKSGEKGEKKDKKRKK